MRKIFFILVSILFSISVFSSQTTEGTEFWVTYMPNSSRTCSSSDLSLELIISSRYDTEVIIENPMTGWMTSEYVLANSIQKVSVPCSEGYLLDAAQVKNKGIRVTSTASISLYASNYGTATYDATIVLPITGLGNE